MTKLEQIRALAADDKWHDAIKIAAKFPRLGSDRVVITRAQEAVSRPDFQRQLGRDPDQLINDGIAAIRAKWRV